MGKGDQRSRRGKIHIGSFGNSRRRRPIKGVHANINKQVKKAVEPSKADKSAEDLKLKKAVEKLKSELLKEAPVSDKPAKGKKAAKADKEPKTDMVAGGTIKGASTGEAKSEGPVEDVMKDKPGNESDAGKE